MEIGVRKILDQVEPEKFLDLDYLGKVISIE